MAKKNIKEAFLSKKKKAAWRAAYDNLFTEVRQILLIFTGESDFFFILRMTYVMPFLDV